MPWEREGSRRQGAVGTVEGWTKTVRHKKQVSTCGQHSPEPAYDRKWLTMQGQKAGIWEDCGTAGKRKSGPSTDPLTSLQTLTFGGTSMVSQVAPWSRVCLLMQETQEMWIRPLGQEEPFSRRQPTLVFLPGRFPGQRILGGYIVHEAEKSWIWVSDRAHTLHLSVCLTSCLSILYSCNWAVWKFVLDIWKDVMTMSWQNLTWNSNHAWERKQMTPLIRALVEPTVTLIRLSIKIIYWDTTMKWHQFPSS